jgi:hypothetical protein
MAGVIKSADGIIGIAACDKNESSRELQVMIPSLLPFYRGEMKATHQDAEFTVNDGKSSRTVTTTTSNVVTAYYRDSDPNNSFPPDVRKGEQVIVYQNEGSHIYYWKSSGRNNNARRTETKRIAISATLENAPDLDDTNTYYIELDTRRDKHIRLKTNKANGESFAYMFNIDAAKSQVILCDDAGNQIFIDSNIPRVFMSNKSNSMIDLNDKNIVIACENDITINAKTGKCHIESGDDMTLKTSAKMTQESASDFDQKSGGKMTMTSGGSMTLTSGGEMMLTSGGAMTLTSGGGLSISYSGSGTCTGKGATMTMTMSRLDIKKG